MLISSGRTAGWKRKNQATGRAGTEAGGRRVSPPRIIGAKGATRAIFLPARGKPHLRINQHRGRQTELEDGGRASSPLCFSTIGGNKGPFGAGFPSVVAEKVLVTSG